jgi:acyl-CoA thioesterase I
MKGWVFLKRGHQGVGMRQWQLHFSLLFWLSLLITLPCHAQGKPYSTGAKNKLVLIMGDSLSAEYGLARGTGWVALLEDRLQQKKRTASVLNASISGETTAGARSRLPQLLSAHQPDVVVIELGGNDALRGLPLNGTQESLAQMARSSRAAGAKVVLVGMQVPPNYGKAYSDRFAGLFKAVAQAEGATLVPFMLKGVADVPEAASFFQADRIHPTAQAQPLILENIWPALEVLLK